MDDLGGGFRPGIFALELRDADGRRWQMRHGNQLIGIEEHPGAVRCAGAHIRRVILIVISVIRERNEFVARGIRELRKRTAQGSRDLPSSCFGFALGGYAEHHSIEWLRDFFRACATISGASAKNERPSAFDTARIMLSAHGERAAWKSTCSNPSSPSRMPASAPMMPIRGSISNPRTVRSGTMHSRERPKSMMTDVFSRSQSPSKKSLSLRDGRFREMCGELLGKLRPVIFRARELREDGILDSHDFKPDGLRCIGKAREQPLGRFLRYFGSGRQSNLEFHNRAVIVERLRVRLAFLEERHRRCRRSVSSENAVNERTEGGWLAGIIHRRSRLNVVIEERTKRRFKLDRVVPNLPASSPPLPIVELRSKALFLRERKRLDTRNDFSLSGHAPSYLW